MRCGALESGSSILRFQRCVQTASGFLRARSRAGDLHVDGSHSPGGSRASCNCLEQTSKSVAFGVQQIHKLTGEITEYLSPPPLQLRAEDLAVVLAEVIRISERELAEHGIRMTVVVKEPLPRLQLDGQFRSALKRVLEFSCALLPEGGELKIEAGLHWMEDDRYVELSLINASPTYLNVPLNDVFRPFLKVNDCRVGLSMAVARQILRRHFGKIAFRQEHRDRGVFSILIKVPSDNGFLQETS